MESKKSNTHLKKKKTTQNNQHFSEASFLLKKNSCKALKTHSYCTAAEPGEAFGGSDESFASVNLPPSLRRWVKLSFSAERFFCCLNEDNETIWCFSSNMFDILYSLDIHDVFGFTPPEFQVCQFILWFDRNLQNQMINAWISWSHRRPRHFGLWTEQTFAAGGLAISRATRSFVTKAGWFGGRPCTCQGHTVEKLTTRWSQCHNTTNFGDKGHYPIIE